MMTSKRGDWANTNVHMWGKRHTGISWTKPHLMAVKTNRADAIYTTVEKGFCGGAIHGANDTRYFPVTVEGLDYVWDKTEHRLGFKLSLGPN